MTYKPRLLFYLITLIATNALGQAPVITHVDNYVNGNNKRVTITGSNFGGNASNLSIWFGAAQATTILTATDQTIEVLVPPGATYESISVTDKSSGLTAWSKGEFQLSYGGTTPIALTDLSAQTDLAAESGLFDVCLCDLDNDGLSDVATSNQGTPLTAPVNSVAIFRNTSTPGSFSFAAKLTMLPSVKSLHVKCGDIDGDGKKDLVVTEADPGNRVFIFKNTSTPGSLSFSSQNITLPGKAPKRAEIADLDGDGKPELIITDQSTLNNDFIILPNTTIAGAISFGTPVYVSGPAGAKSTDGLAVQDLNGDNKPEIVTNQFLNPNSNIHIFENESNAGNFRFTKITVLPLAGNPVNLRVGDIDGDSKLDIVATQLLGSQISVFLNQSTSTQMQFGTVSTVSTDLVPWGLDFGDLNGDNKLDVVVASLTGTGAVDPKSLTILSNTSTPGSVSFLPKLIRTTTFANRHIAIGDLDGDSKPDITYTSVDDNSRGIVASKVSFFRNTACITPVVTPGGTLVVCASFPITLESTVAPGATYSWKKDNVAMGITTSTLTPVLTGHYTVDITSDGCTQTSNDVDVTVSAGAATPPTFTNNSPLCIGGTISLTASSVGGTSFSWTGPAGFTSNGAIVTRGPFVPEFAGRYEVEVMAGGCLAAKGSTLVESISLPAFSVAYSGSDVICAPGTKTLTASPNDPNFTYQWTVSNGDIGGAVNPTFAAAASGVYSFKAKSTLYPGCPEVIAESATIKLATAPNPAFSAPDETCKDSPTVFTNQSLVQEDAEPIYKWEFGDAGTSTDKNATHVYTATGSLTVKLTVSYRGDACATDISKPITISLPPVASITAPGNNFVFCEGETLTLSVSAPFTEYKWSTGATTPTLDITGDGNYKVDVKTAIGCKITLTKLIDALDAPPIIASATPLEVNLGESVNLSASPIYDVYEWTPGETLNDPTSQNPIAKPTITTKYVVTVVDALNGCFGRDTVEVVVHLDNPTNLLKVANFFSPNGDDTNPIWRVEPESIISTCGVTVFDEKGSKVYEAKPYNNDWDGTSNGKRLPDGVYYYVIRCDGDSSQKTGSITILR